jgi:hypothetical protein
MSTQADPPERTAQGTSGAGTRRTGEPGQQARQDQGPGVPIRPYSPTQSSWASPIPPTAANGIDPVSIAPLTWWLRIALSLTVTWLGLLPGGRAPVDLPGRPRRQPEMDR